MRKIIAAGALSIACGAPLAAQELSQVFAACAGRYSAEMEHAWLLDTARADALQDRRDAFVQLTEASGSPSSAAHLLNLRIQAKYAQARLLNAASFARTPAQAGRAQRLALVHLHTCEKMLLRG